ncbi:MAG: pyridoxamine 5'-phosphate oxidase family protein [Ilumatobacter sp.]|uniref:pyridoxamine 5'-phosphate oxidase family protein n=1 Tax=Ilumatobacter sp. TaxID=1967498 RepID=UPI0032979E7B
MGTGADTAIVGPTDHESGDDDSHDTVGDSGSVSGGGSGSGGYTDSYEDVSGFTLSDDREATLLATQTECVFMWTTRDGDPVGVVMNFVWHAGAFWLTCTRRRKRVPAIEARPRVAVAVSSRGTDIGISQAVTYKGTATVLDDDATLAWFSPVLAAKVRPGDTAKQAAFVAHLDSPGRVVVRIDVDTRIGFDSEAMFAGSPAGATTTRITGGSTDDSTHDSTDDEDATDDG